MTKKFEIVYRDPADLIPYEMNAKKHDEQQIRDLAAAIKKRGFDQPITVDKNDVIITGHGRREAAILLDLSAYRLLFAMISVMTRFVRSALKITDLPALITMQLSYRKNLSRLFWTISRFSALKSGS